MYANWEPRLAPQHDHRNEMRKRHLFVDPKLSVVYLLSSFNQALTQLLMTRLVRRTRSSRETSFHCDCSP